MLFSLFEFTGIERTSLLACLDVIVRPARPEDAASIVGFNRAMALETEGKELDADRTALGVAGAFEDRSRATYWVAESGGKAVASLMLTTEWSDWRNGTFWWIQSVYVVPECRGQGVFKALHRAVRELARSEPGVCGLRLYVERENEPARAVYTKLGMEETPYRLYEEDFVL